MKIFDRFARWFARFFGSARMFAIVVAVVLVWLAVMPWIGVERWNATLGLAGNTVESTLELFLAVTIQYVATQVENAQQEHMARLERIERLIAEKLGISEEEEQ